LRLARRRRAQSAGSRARPAAKLWALVTASTETGGRRVEAAWLLRGLARGREECERCCWGLPWRSPATARPR
jgi:hypothetical protein